MFIIELRDHLGPGGAKHKNLTSTVTHHVHCMYVYMSVQTGQFSYLMGGFETYPYLS